MTVARHVSDEERRARLARRHAVAGPHRAAGVEAAARAVVVLHATEPASVHLAAAARVDGLTPSDVDAALYDTRHLVKQLAMRRTLFVFPRDLLPAAWGSTSARVAAIESRKIGQNVVDAGLATDGYAWLEEARAAVLEVLAEAGDLSAQEIRARVPLIDHKVTVSATSVWGGPLPVGPRVLTWLGARAEIVRGVNGGHWRTSRPRWTPMAAWLGEEPVPLTEDAGWAELVRRWLERFGPGTEDDLVWWLGSTKTAVRRALAALEAVEVSLDGGRTGWLLPDDVDPEPEVEPWAALLPVLDPTTMGWKHRDFYLDPAHRPYHFDTAGNAGTTAWWNGRIVGAWVQDDAGVVQVLPRGELAPPARRALAAEAERLTAFFDGTVVTPIYKSAQMKGR